MYYTILLMSRDRIAKVQKSLVAHKIGALLVSDFYNILYLTGFKTSVPEEHEAFLLVTKKEAVLFTDRRYKPNYKPFLFYSREKRLTGHLEEISKKSKVKKIGIEGDSLTVSEYQTLSKKLPKLSFIATVGVVMEQRQIKDSGEIEKIRQACKLTDQCLSAISKTIKVGQTEKEVAFNIEQWAKKRGCDLAFSPQVASGRNTAVIHYEPKDSNRRIQKNSLILIDIGLKYKDYCSDVSRMFVVGTPTKKQQDSYVKLLQVEENVLKKIANGKSLKEVDDFCRNEIKKNGLPDFFHATGHGVGLDVHEPPVVSFRDERMIREGNVFAIEPGAYFDGEFGMRIEDTIVILKNKVEVLTKFPKKLLQL